MWRRLGPPRNAQFVLAQYQRKKIAEERCLGVIYGPSEDSSLCADIRKFGASRCLVTDDLAI